MTTDLVEPCDDPLGPIPAPGCDWDGLLWYAIRTNPRCEAKATAGLREAGFEVFHPVCRSWQPKRRVSRLAKTWRQVERSLWPGYILVGMAGYQAWFALRRVDGVHGPVHVDGIPVALSACKVQDVYARVVAGEFDEDHRPRRRRSRAYAKGETIAINSGGLAGMTAVVRKPAKANAAAVWADLVGGGKKVRVPVEAIAEAVA